MIESYNHSVAIAKGNIYLERETWETYLKGVNAAALLPHDDGILKYPLIGDSAGRLLLKVLNQRGDRISHAQEFFRVHNYVESFEMTKCSVRWITERVALLVVGVSRI